MKKTILAAAIPALLATCTSVNAAELVNQGGNRLQMNGKLSVSAYQDEDTDLEISPSGEIIFLVDSEINDDLTLSGFTKIKINTAEDSVTDGVITLEEDDDGYYWPTDDEEDDWSTVSADDIFLTLRGSWGEFSFGKQAALQDFYNVAEESHNIVDGPVVKNLISPNHEASVKYFYRAPNYNIGISYGFEEEETELNMWEIGGDVTFGDLNIQAMYADASSIYGTVEAEELGDASYDGDSDMTYYTLVAKYKLDQFVLGAGVNAKEVEYTDSTIETTTLSVRYTLNPEMSLFAGYEEMDEEGDKTEYMYAGLDYNMSNNTSLFVELGNSDDTESAQIGVDLMF